MPICPQCREEYDDGVGVCFDCGVNLVEPDHADPAGPSEEITVIRAGNEENLAVMEKALEQWEIPCRRVGDAGNIDGVDPKEPAIVVPARFADKATRILLNLRISSEERIPSEDKGDNEKHSETSAHDVISESALLSRSFNELIAMGDGVIDDLIELVVRGNPEIQARAAAALVMIGGRGLEAALKLMKVALEKEEVGMASLLLKSLFLQLQQPQLIPSSSLQNYQ